MCRIFLQPDQSETTGQFIQAEEKKHRPLGDKHTPIPSVGVFENLTLVVCVAAGGGLHHQRLRPAGAV